MPPRPPDAAPGSPVPCQWCGALYERVPERCWVCQRPFRQAAFAAPASEPKRTRWPEQEGAGGMPWSTYVLVPVLAGLTLVAPGLAIVALMIGAPVVMAKGGSDRKGWLGLLLGMLGTGLLLMLAIGVAFCLVCTGAIAPKGSGGLLFIAAGLVGFLLLGVGLYWVSGAARGRDDPPGGRE